MPWLCDALRDAFAPRCVASLCVGFWIPRHNSNLASLHTLGRFLHHTCSQSIRHLSFPVIINSAVASGSNDSDKAMFWRTLHLHEFTGMYTFDMSLAVVDSGTHPDSDDAPRVPLSAVCVAIFALLPPTLRRITITLWEVKEASQVKDKRMLGLSALDDALDARAPVLEQVRLVFRGEWYLLEFAEAATKAMAKCRKRGILEVGDWLHMG
ncbi:hypothetical protein FKP32DRAFT_1605482 [Trametes sanguinea]|nr:hypothetical protein FKP32DRAFT_1605482 [Trametes sanguinea]